MAHVLLPRMRSVPLGEVMALFWLVHEIDGKRAECAIELTLLAISPERHRHAHTTRIRT